MKPFEEFYTDEESVDWKRIAPVGSAADFLGIRPVCPFVSLAEFSGLFAPGDNREVTFAGREGWRWMMLL